MMRYWLAAALLLEILAGGWVAEAATIPVRFTLKSPGNVSVAVYDAQGQRLLRTLLSGTPLSAGPHEIAWDGLDRDGNPAAPGAYTWKLLQTNGLKAEYLLTVGTNPGNAPWASWPGNHGGVTSVAVDDSGMYLSSSCSEVPPGIFKQTLDGKTRLWEHGNYEAWQGGQSMAGMNGVLYQLQFNGKLQCLNPTNGGLKATRDLRIIEEKPDEKDANGKPVTITTVPSDMDAAGGVIAITYKEKNLVRWLAPEDGRTLAEAPAAAPMAVAVAPSGVTYVASASSVLAFAKGGTAPSVLVAGLTAPHRLAVEPDSGNLLVVEGGESQQIKRYSAAGKLLKTYGKRGGRRAEGLYDLPTSFYQVEDIAADGKGGFFIVEPNVAPRRTTHIDRAGKLVAEWYGGQMFFQGISPDPDDPTTVWLDSHWGWIMQAKLDLKKRTWRVLATYQLGGMASGLIPGKGNASVNWEVRRRNGVTYLVRQGGLPCILKVDAKQHRLLPLVAGATNITHYWDYQPQFIKDLLENNRRAKWLSYLWTDADGDGLPQKAEVRLSEWSCWWGGWYLDDDYNLYATDGTQVYRLPCTGWSPLGAPLYPDPVKWEKGVTRPATAPPLAGYSADTKALFHDRQGNFYSISNDQNDPHGWGWTGDMFSRNALLKWDPQGNSLWTVGRHAVARPNPPGQFHNPCRIVGESHGCVVIAERVVQPAVVWDADGLYVGTFFDRRADDGLPREMYCWWQHPEGSAKSPLPDGAINYDCLIGGSIATLPNGDVLWYAMGWNNNPVYRITGWDGWQRQQGALTVADAPAYALGTGSGLSGQYFAGREPKGDPAFARLDPQVAFDWKDGTPDKEKIAALPFSARWEGLVEAKYSEDYRFSVYANDGARLWMNDQLLIDGWKDSTGEMHYHYTRNERFNTYVSEPIALEAGKKYHLVLEYYKATPSADKGTPRLRLNWESATQDRVQIPKAYLYTM